MKPPGVLMPFWRPAFEFYINKSCEELKRMEIMNNRKGGDEDD
jgi:hypothetical protein